MKLSIITINFNNADGLRKTIESIVNQTFTDYEYIVIDGGSTDGSVDIIRQYADRISFWISEPDSGIYNAMNKGIKAAKGEYCLFMNSGDTIYSNSVLHKVFELEFTSDIITGNMLKQFPNRKTYLDKGAGFSVQKNRRQLTLLDFYKGGNLNHQATFIKRSLFEKYGLYDERWKIASDWKFFMQSIAISGETIQYIDLTVSRFDMTGISSENPSIFNSERTAILNEIFPKSILYDYNELIKFKNSLVYLMICFFQMAVNKIINKIKKLIKL
jgi:glycosyltransferase involved in cell wall biosynthesis